MASRYDTVSFKIILADGKAPYKLIWLDRNENEVGRTHHKRLDLAHARADLWNSKIPVIDATK